jgi:hypothetical protein
VEDGAGSDAVTHVVWKFEIPAQPSFTLDMRLGARVLSVQLQDGKPMLWALVDTSQPERTFAFRSVPTGLEFDPTGLTFAGTFQPLPGLVFHLFWTGA